MLSTPSQTGTRQQVMLAHGGGGELTKQLIAEHILPKLGNPYLSPLTDAAILPIPFGTGGPGPLDLGSRLTPTASQVLPQCHPERSRHPEPPCHPERSEGSQSHHVECHPVADPPWRERSEGSQPQPGRLALTTDAFVVQPLCFPGGDIGRLAVCGTINDLAVMGARPIALTLALIIEEGLSFDTLDRVLTSIAEAATEAGVPVVSGDTKVVERQQGDRASEGLTITTTGLGQLRDDVCLDAARLTPGDAVIINGHIADHGLAVMSAREGLSFQTDLKTDAAPLNGLIDAVLDTGADVKFMRDPTRGGLAGTLADLVEDTGLSIQLDESAIPITRVARHTAEMLGLDPLTVANEGKVVIVVAAPDAEKVLAACKAHPYGRHAAAIGRITGDNPPLVELNTRAGGSRIVQRPYGEELPRIC